MDQLNRIMARRGYLTVFDHPGEYHYILAGEHDAHLVVNRIERVIREGAPDPQGVHPTPHQLQGAVDLVLARHLVSRRHKGSLYLSEILFHMAPDRKNWTEAAKCLYIEIGKRHRVPACHVERNLRYTIRNSGLPRSLPDCSNLAVIRTLHAEVLQHLRKLQESEAIPSSQAN